MISNGVAHARTGDLELRFGGAPPPAHAVPVIDGDAVSSGEVADPDVPATTSDDDEERATLETLLHSSGTSNVPALLAAIQRSRARPT